MDDGLREEGRTNLSCGRSRCTTAATAATTEIPMLLVGSGVPATTGRPRYRLASL